MNSDQWREDLRFFTRAVRRHHKNPFHLVREEQFQNAVTELEARIPSLKDDEMIVSLQSLAAMIGDGHTFLATWDIQHFYPLTLYWFKDELRVIRTITVYEEVLGMRLIGIDGVSLSEIHGRMQSVIPQGENKWYVLQQSANQILRAEVLTFLNITTSSEQANFDFENDEGNPLRVNIASVPPDTKLNWIGLAMPSLLYEQRPHEPFWFKALPDMQILYLHFRGYSDLAQHAREFWEFVDQQAPQKLIVDMRQNGGGNYTLARSHLIYEIQKRPALNAPGRLFVVIGRGTFSAAMTNALDFRRETDAILVGEPSGARPVGYQENYWITLPHSGLQASLACRFYKFQDLDTPAVLPDHIIEPNWTDYKAGRDPVLEWIFLHGSNT